MILLFPQALVKKSKTFVTIKFYLAAVSVCHIDSEGKALGQHSLVVTGCYNLTVQQCFIKDFYYYFKTRKNVNPYSASLALLFSLARKKPSGLESAATIRTKVFVWGLNDKDQLGGLKGSKVPFIS